MMEPHQISTIKYSRLNVILNELINNLITHVNATQL